MVILSPSKVTILKGRPNLNPNKPDNLINNDHNGIFSAKARKNMLGKMATWFIASQTFLKHGQLCYKKKASKFTFLTLSLPATQAHSDQEIKATCLNNFFNKLRYYRKNLQYVWKAEKQKNGNIHFHIILNSYFDFRLTDALWHQSLELLGYISAYEKKHKSRYPPTNKIEQVISKKRLMSYAAKYMAKIVDKTGIDGRIWYASSALQTEVRAISWIEPEHIKILLHNANELGLKVIENDYVYMVCLNNVADVKALPPNMREAYVQVLEYINARFDDSEIYDSKYKFEFPELDYWIKTVEAKN